MVEIVPGTQSSFSAVLNFEGESTVLAVHRRHEYHLPNPLRARWLFVTELGPNYRELFQEIADDAREDGVQIALNPGAIQLEENDRTLHELLEQTSLLVVNKDEAQELCGCDLVDPRPLLRTLQEMGPKIIVITDGEHGAWATENSVIYFAPAFPGKRVEATGAGDAFSTGVIAALILEKPLDVALAWGSVNAASVVQYVGPHAGLLARESLEKRLCDMPDYRVKEI
ncbi:bifunctional hydroxymethylpyrimidine kinase/phosphomethylpyrimidine kinase [Candidatus Uhrbacteria bacterium]|nr:bifunctional hydroxymethylpyrimidine kinase/phosphomethylpyrimidine kinase [Candidatus Uhrbacteria bacterium]